MALQADRGVMLFIGIHVGVRIMAGNAAQAIRSLKIALALLDAERLEEVRVRLRKVLGCDIAVGVMTASAKRDDLFSAGGAQIGHVRVSQISRAHRRDVGAARPVAGFAAHAHEPGFGH